jgi:dihydroxyacetone kinase-like predicted kinase
VVSVRASWRYGTPLALWRTTRLLFESVLDSLDGDGVRHWCAAGLAGLRRHQHEIDELNVYPVPDGDTGTNLVLTFTAADEHLAGEPPADLAKTMAGFARGALLGARGNSGVIMSQLLAGFAETCGRAAARGRGLADGLRAAADAAYEAVAVPVEGTILSVARAAGLAATDVDSDDLEAVAVAAAGAAAVALAKTPDQLPELARAGVVDAGGRGLLVVLDALVEVVTGRRESRSADATEPTVAHRVSAVARETGSSAYAFEVQLLLDADAGAVDTLKSALTALGDSLVIVGTGTMPAGDTTLAAEAALPTWNVHVHVNDVGAAIEASVRAGHPHRISVTHFADQIAAAEQTAAVEQTAGDHAAHARPTSAAEQTAATTPTAATKPAASGDQIVTPDQPIATAVTAQDPPVPPHDRVAAKMFEPAALAPGEPTDGARPRRATVVVATGRGLAALFEAEGAVVVDGPNPSTAEILAAIRATGGSRVVVLPDVAATQGTASAAAHEARRHNIRVSVVPTRSPVQALAALAVRDAGRRFDDDVIAMAEAAGACRYAEVTYASREAITIAGRCQAGDVLGLVEGEVNIIGTDLGQTCRDLLDRLLAAGGELVTLLTGKQAPADLAPMLSAHLAKRWPFVEAQTYAGGQPHHPLLVGIE